MQKIILSLAYTYMGIVWILSGLIYIWTLIIANTLGGTLAAIVTFFFPVIGQLYWAYRSWRISGFDSTYIQWLIVLVALWVIQYLVFATASIFDSSRKRRY